MKKTQKGKSRIPVMFSFLYKDPLEAIELISKYDIKNLLSYHGVVCNRKEKVGSIIESQVSCCDYCDSLFAFDKIDPFPFGIVQVEINEPKLVPTHQSWFIDFQANIPFIY